MPERDVIIDNSREDGGPEVVAIHDMIHTLNPGEAFTPEQIKQNVDPENPNSVTRISSETGFICRLIRQESRIWAHWLLPADAGVQILVPTLLGAEERAVARWPEVARWNIEGIFSTGVDAQGRPDEGAGAAQRWHDFLATAGLGTSTLTRHHFENDPHRDRHYILSSIEMGLCIRILRVIKERLR